MKRNDFYSVLVPLINSILTGYPDIDFTGSRIRLSPAFVAAYNAPTATRFYLHLVRCMELYFKSASEKVLIDFTTFFVENRNLLSIAVLIRDADCEVPQSEAYYNDELILILLDFIDQKHLDVSLLFTLYLYLENLLEIDMENQSIAVEVYENILKCNLKYD